MRDTVEPSRSLDRTDFIAGPQAAFVVTESRLSSRCWWQIAACCDSEGSCRAVSRRWSRYSDATQLCQPQVTGNFHAHAWKTSMKPSNRNECHGHCCPFPSPEQLARKKTINEIVPVLVLVVLIFCISYVTNLALWLQDFNKLTYLPQC